MGSKKSGSNGAIKKRSSVMINRGAWTAEEDRRLAECIEIHGPRRWKSLAVKSGLNRCGKSCRLRWLNYLRPDIKRGNISIAEDDLILRLHRLLGNRWSLIARRLPGRTDNEIKNYWNSHLSKKASLMEKLPATSIISTTTDHEQTNYNNNSSSDDDNADEKSMESNNCVEQTKETDIQASNGGDEDADQLSSDDDDELFDFSTQGTNGLEWVKHFLELEGDP